MQHLTIPELKSLLSAIADVPDGWQRGLPPERLRLMVLVTFNHGLRVSETITLKGSNIRGGFVAVKRLKGSNPTVQPYVYDPDPELDESVALTELARTVKAKELLFPISRDGFRKLMKRAGKRAGIEEGARYHNKLHPHALKHSIAKQVIGTAGIENVRQWLGHKSIASTGEYLKVSDETAALAVSAARGQIAHAAGNAVPNEGRTMAAAGGA